MPITTLQKVKSSLQISGTNKDTAITELIPLVEDWIKGYCNDDFLVDGAEKFPSDYESIAIEMIANDLNKLAKSGVQSEGLSRYNVQYVAGVTAQRYPQSVTRRLRRKLRW
jgi:hypothetical protein